MARRTFTMVDLIELYVHWYAGRSKSALAESLGLDRGTIRKYLAPAEAAGLVPGGDPIGEEVWREHVAEWFPKVVDAKLRQITWPAIAVHRDYIVEQLKAGVTKATIHQRLRDGHGLDAGLTSLKRWIEANLPDEVVRGRVTVCRPPVPPGEEAQIDYGSLGMWLDPVTGRRRRVWAFIMVLASSRHMFVRPVLTMDQASWTAAHVAAFDFFGGAPHRLVPDNLKTGVERPDLYDPKLNRSYGELGRHYGTLIDPARARKPKDKARVERQVPYVRDSFWRGREFASLAEMQTAAVTWCLQVAGRRAHRGLDGAAPLAVFEAAEREALIPLPATRFTLATWSIAKVAPDCLLLTELLGLKQQVSGQIRVRCSTVAAHVRRRRSSPGPRPRLVGGSVARGAGGDRRRVGAVLPARSGRRAGRCGVCLLPRSAGGRAQRGHDPLVRDGPLALVPVPVGIGYSVAAGFAARGARLLPLAADRRQTGPASLAQSERYRPGRFRRAVRGLGACAQRDGAALLLRLPLGRRRLAHPDQPVPARSLAAGARRERPSQPDGAVPQRALRDVPAEGAEAGSAQHPR
jgi:transposase